MDRDSRPTLAQIKAVQMEFAPKPTETPVPVQARNLEAEERFIERQIAERASQLILVRRLMRAGGSNAR